MADDNLLVTVQTAITNIVSTAETIEETSNYLKEDIARVTTHNASPQAHPDIRTELTEVPHTTITPSVAGARTVKSGDPYPYTLTSGTILPDAYIAKFKLDMPDASVMEVTDNIVNNTTTVELTFTGERNETQSVAVTAFDQNQIASPPYDLGVTLYHNDPPIVDGLICSGLPEYLNPNESVSFTLTGATDIDIPYGDTLKFSIENTGLNFSVTSDIVMNQQITVTAPYDAVRGSTMSFTVVAVDQYAASTAKVFSIKINQLPILDNLVQNTPALIVAGESAILRFSGATDPDNQQLTYEVSPISPEITFSKLTGIAENEAITMNINAAATHGNILQYRLYVRDSTGAAVNTVITTQVNTPPNITNLEDDLPDILVPGQIYTFHLTGATDVDGNPITYSINCTDPSLVFSKTTGITEAEALTLTVEANALRGSNIPVQLIATDSLGSSSTKQITLRVNVLPTFSTPSISGLPTYVIPGETYDITFGVATNPEVSQVLKYSIDANTNITYSKMTDIALNETVQMTVNSGVTRGSTLSIGLNLTDGLETVTSALTTKVNQLPSIVSLIVNNLPSIAKPNATIALSLSGATAMEFDQTITYSIASDSPKVTFSKNTDITAGESFDLIIASDAVRGQVVTLTVSVSDGLETVQSTAQLTINSLPSTEVAHNIPSIVAPNSNIQFSLSSIDADATQSLTYSLSGTAGLSFSKTTGIAKDEIITLFVSSGVTRGATGIITVTISDGLETVQTQINTTYNTLPTIPDTILNAIPAIIKPNTEYAFTLTGGSSEDIGQAYTYTIASDNTKAVLSKLPSDVIAEGGVVTLTTASDITRGSTVTLTVTISDGLETAHKEFEFTINQLVSVNTAIFNLPALVSPQSATTGFNGQYTNCAVTGITNAEVSQTILFDIACDDTHVTFSKSTGLEIGELFTTTIGSGVTRGSTLTFTLTITDGLETVTKQFTRTVNSVPAHATLSNLPVTMNGGQSLTISYTSSDTDGNQIYFNAVVSGLTGISPTTFNNVMPGQDMSMTIPYVSVETTVTITGTAFNQILNVNGNVIGNDWETPSEHTFKVEPVYVLNAPTITSPTEGATLASDVVTFNISAISETLLS